MLVRTKQYVKVMRTANAYRQFKLVHTYVCTIPYQKARISEKEINTCIKRKETEEQKATSKRFILPPVVLLKKFS